MSDRYYCIKTENIWYILHYFLHYFVSPFHNVSRTHFSLTMLVLGPGSTHLVMAANLWPRYDHIESCVAVHEQHMDCLLIHGFSPVNARLLITCDTAFYAIMVLTIWLYSLPAIRRSLR